MDTTDRIRRVVDTVRKILHECGSAVAVSVNTEGAAVSEACRS